MIINGLCYSHQYIYKHLCYAYYPIEFYFSFFIGRNLNAIFGVFWIKLINFASYKHFIIMKKLLTIALLALPYLGFAQSIVSNTHIEGNHIVVTDKQICRSFTDTKVLAVGLSAGKGQESGKYTYFLDLKITSSEKIVMERGAEMTLWLKGGEVLKLSLLITQAQDLFAIFIALMDLSHTTTAHIQCLL